MKNNKKHAEFVKELRQNRRKESMQYWVHYGSPRYVKENFFFFFYRVNRWGRNASFPNGGLWASPLNESFRRNCLRENPNTWLRYCESNDTMESIKKYKPKYFDEFFVFRLKKGARILYLDEDTDEEILKNFNYEDLIGKYDAIYGTSELGDTNKYNEEGRVVEFWNMDALLVLNPDVIQVTRKGTIKSRTNDPSHPSTARVPYIPSKYFSKGPTVEKIRGMESTTKGKGKANSEFGYVLDKAYENLTRDINNGNFWNRIKEGDLIEELRSGDLWQDYQRGDLYNSLNLRDLYDEINYNDYEDANITTIVNWKIFYNMFKYEAEKCRDQINPITKVDPIYPVNPISHIRKVYGRDPQEYIFNEYYIKYLVLIGFPDKINMKNIEKRISNEIDEKEYKKKLTNRKPIKAWRECSAWDEKAFQIVDDIYCNAINETQRTNELLPLNVIKFFSDRKKMCRYPNKDTGAR